MKSDFKSGGLEKLNFRELQVSITLWILTISLQIPLLGSRFKDHKNEE